MRSKVITRPALTAAVLAFLIQPVLADPVTPDSIAGLEAWYRADSLEEKVGNGGIVKNWKDDSGNGHHLTYDENGVAAVLRAHGSGNVMTVDAGKAGSYSVTQPFSLADHTIFVVYRTGTTQRALFRSETDPYSGLLLRKGGNQDAYHDGGSQPGRVKIYTEPFTLGSGYSITILGREGERLTAYSDGIDVGVGTAFGGGIRVGKFFSMSLTKFARSDGHGLQIGEMIFYSRHLTDQERDAVTVYLADRFNVALEEEVSAGSDAVGIGGQGEAVRYAVLAQLSTTTDIDINKSLTVIPWDRQLELDYPFLRESGTPNTRLTCATEDTRVRLYVSLPLTSEAEVANIGIFFRVNGAKFLPGEGRSGPLGKAGGAAKGSVQAETVTVLNDGDYVEVVIRTYGGPGKVTIDPHTAIFTAEVK